MALGLPYTMLYIAERLDANYKQIFGCRSLLQNTASTYGKTTKHLHKEVSSHRYPTQIHWHCLVLFHLPHLGIQVITRISNAAVPTYRQNSTSNVSKRFAHICETFSFFWRIRFLSKIVLQQTFCHFILPRR